MRSLTVYAEYIDLLLTHTRAAMDTKFPDVHWWLKLEPGEEVFHATLSADYRGRVYNRHAKMHAAEQGVSVSLSILVTAVDYHVGALLQQLENASGN